MKRLVKHVDQTLYKVVAQCNCPPYSPHNSILLNKFLEEKNKTPWSDRIVSMFILLLQLLITIK